METVYRWTITKSSLCSPQSGCIHLFNNNQILNGQNQEKNVEREMFCSLFKRTHKDDNGFLLESNKFLRSSFKII